MHTHKKRFRDGCDEKKGKDAPSVTVRYCTIGLPSVDGEKDSAFCIVKARAKVTQITHCLAYD